MTKETTEQWLARAKADIAKAINRACEERDPSEPVTLVGSDNMEQDGY